MDAFLRQVKSKLAGAPKLVRVAGFSRAVFVGDTHGDLEASERVIDHYFDEQTALIFLGDYVDRGPNSLENIRLLLQLKLDHPDQVILLQGNHEGWKVSPFYPADFWEGLEPETRESFADVLALLPLAATLPNGVLALHGALPAVEGLDGINGIQLGSDLWRQITWGDWTDMPDHSLGDLGSRPQFGRDRFEMLMERLEMNVLIRGHQPNAPILLYNNRCITIFTSSAYERPRSVAVVNFNQKIRSAEDLTIEQI